MSAHHIAVVPARILRKWDALAAIQLCDAAASLSEQIDQLCTELQETREELRRADDCAESWRDDALRMQEQLCETAGGQPGITQQGQLVIVSGVTQ